METFEKIIIGIGAVLLILTGIIVYKDITSEHISIRKDEWNCVISHKESYIIPSGKIMIPTTKDICDRYERNK